MILVWHVARLDFEPGVFVEKTVRPATPEDAAAISELIYMADTGYTGVSGWDLMFSEPKEEILEKIKWLFLNGERTWFYHKRYIVAEVDGRVVATLCTFDRDDSSMLANWRYFREMGYGTIQILRFAWRMIPFLLVNPSVPKGTLVVESAAILPEYRGAELARVGLEYAADRARREGYKRVQVSVVIGNMAPQLVCEHFGFKAQKDYTSRLFEKKYGAPGMRRLVYEVNSQQTPR